MSFLDKTISALVYTIAAEYDRHREVRRAGPYARVVSFVSGQVAHMTAPLRLPMRIATCGLSLLAFLGTGCLFHHLPPVRREKLVQRWRVSAFGPVRDVMRFYDSLTVLAIYASEAG